MNNSRIPKPGEIYHHFKDKPYQIITVATHTETNEPMVVYQALYGNFKTYVRPLDMFLSEVDHEKYPEVKQKYRFELRNPEVEEDTYKQNTSDQNRNNQNNNNQNTNNQKHHQLQQSVTLKHNIINDTASFSASGSGQEDIVSPEEIIDDNSNGEVNSVLLKFLDAESYTKKLEVLTTNRKHLSDRLINDMAVALDCAVDEGPLDIRIQGLINCLEAMRRFEDRRLR